MSFKSIIYFVSFLIFILSSSFCNGVENAFSFLFWYHFIFLIPIIVIFFMLQFFGITLAISPLFTSIMGGSSLIIGGWLLLIFFGTNSALTLYISNNIDSAKHILDIPPFTLIAIIIYAVFNMFAPKIKKSFTYRKSNTSEKEYDDNDVIIDAEHTDSNDIKRIER